MLKRLPNPFAEASLEDFVIDVVVYFLFITPGSTALALLLGRPGSWDQLREKRPWASGLTGLGLWILLIVAIQFVAKSL